MSREDRRAAIAAYKERKVPAGIYAIRCSATGQCWVGSARDLVAIRNRHWFGLRQGGSPRRDLQDAWRQHGEAAFTFEIIETLKDDLKDYERDRALVERLEFWRAKLEAQAI